MALLFVGGVMSLPWIALLAVVVLLEKLAPIGEAGGKVLGALAASAGLVLIIDPALLQGSGMNS
jgi:predicted metal-binding membrane protein